MRIALLCLVVLLAGCSSTNISELITAMGTDQATVCFQGTYGPGAISFGRTNLSSGDVKCGPLEVHSQGTTQIPVTVTPSTGPVPVQIIPQTK